jgi:hypothetical protein
MGEASANQAGEGEGGSVKTRNDLTAEQVRELLDYDPETGKLYWVKPPKNHAEKAGRECGSELRCASGLVYRRMSFCGGTYLVHRLIWLMHYGAWPESDIDHENGDGLDNRIENLRLADLAENSKNRKRYVNNSTGVTGVYAAGNKWMVRIRSGSRLHHVGYFDDFDAAVRARKRADREFGFHRNHGRVA